MKWIWRIVAVLVALPLLCAGVLLAMGMRGSAGRTHASIEIRGGPDRIWPWLDQSDKLKQWVSWLVDVREDPNSHAVNGKRVWVMRDENNGGELMEIPFTFTEYAPPSKMTVHASMPGTMEGLDAYRITDLGNGISRVESDGQYRYQMWMARLMEPLITSQAEAKMARDLAHLKELVEKGEPASVR
jgi:hypothetical protein